MEYFSGRLTNWVTPRLKSYICEGLAKPGTARVGPSSHVLKWKVWTGYRTGLHDYGCTVSGHHGTPGTISINDGTERESLCGICRPLYYVDRNVCTGRGYEYIQRRFVAFHGDAACRDECDVALHLIRSLKFLRGWLLFWAQIDMKHV